MPLSPYDDWKTDPEYYDSSPEYDQRDEPTPKPAPKLAPYHASRALEGRSLIRMALLLMKGGNAAEAECLLRQALEKMEGLR